MFVEAGNLWAIRFSQFSGTTPLFWLDDRTPAGARVVPPQFDLPAVAPAIWAFKAYGAGRALLADGSSRIWPFRRHARDRLRQPPPRARRASAVAHRLRREVGERASDAHAVANPTCAGAREWTGTSWFDLAGTSETVGLAEDSSARLWSLGPCFDLRRPQGSTWTPVPNDGPWGVKLQRDPTRPGTIWASTEAEAIRTVAAYRYSRDYHHVPERDTQSDRFSPVAAAPNGIALLGSTQGPFGLDAGSGTRTFFTWLGGIATGSARPRAVTPGGRVRFNRFDPSGTGPHGLAWFDGTPWELNNAPREGQPQWRGLSRAQIRALEVCSVPGGYELRMACASRSMAVRSVPTAVVFQDGFEQTASAAPASTTVAVPRPPHGLRPWPSAACEPHRNPTGDPRRHPNARPDRPMELRGPQ